MRTMKRASAPDTDRPLRSCHEYEDEAGWAITEEALQLVNELESTVAVE